MASHRERFLAACVQMRAGDDKAKNVARACAFVEAAAQQGARLVVLPEVFAWRGPASRDDEIAEPLTGPTLRALGDVARRCRLTIVAGSILERPEGGATAATALPWNTSTVIGEDGEVLAAYRKIHLFDVSLPGRVEVRESARRSPGDAPVCVDTEVARLGLSVCYDLRFPELYRALSRSGAQVLCVPSAFTFPTGAAHWDVLVRARAIENQCYVVAPNQIGPTADGHHDYGHSSIVDPWGTVVARASDGEGVVVGEIDLAYLARVRSELPCLEHARLLA
ncbi:MAG TPA: carbon-nitrogen hydrolase family protein [Candidatus Binatia bacterium]|nr:carbon-nitrogen hydrolase family protein [Candidatus Binatia bacterium]